MQISRFSFGNVAMKFFGNTLKHPHTPPTSPQCPLRVLAWHLLLELGIVNTLL